MKTTALVIAATLALSGAALAQTSPGNGAGAGTSGETRSGTMNSTGPNDAGSGSSPGAAGRGSSTESMGHSSTGAKDAGSASTPGAGSTSGGAR